MPLLAMRCARPPGCPMRYDLVVFDLDGTLVDSFAFFLRTHNVLAATHGFRPIDATEVEALRHKSAREIMAQLGLPLWKLPRVARSFVELMRDEGRQIRLFDGVERELLALHRQGVRLAVVTSNSRENARRLLGDTLGAVIAYIDGGASILGKQRRIRKCMRTLGVRASRTIYVGDQVTDAKAARDCGVAFASVAWGYGAPQALARTEPDVELSHIAEIQWLASGHTWLRPSWRSADH